MYYIQKFHCHTEYIFNVWTPTLKIYCTVVLLRSHITTVSPTVEYQSVAVTSFNSFQLFREQLDYIRTHHKGKKQPSVHVLGDFNFKDIDWPDRLSKSGSTLSVGGTNID